MRPKSLIMWISITVCSLSGERTVVVVESGSASDHVFSSFHLVQAVISSPFLHLSSWAAPVNRYREPD